MQINRRWTNLALAWLARAFTFAYAAMLTVAWWDESYARRELYTGGPNDWFWEWAIFTHVLPVLIVIAALVAGWKYPIYGALGFAPIVLLNLIAIGGEWMYLPFFAGPPAVVGAIYLVGWVVAGRRQAQPS